MSQANSGSSHEGIDLAGLVITAVASAAAAYASSKLWSPGTLPAAATTPVIIALVREALRRPREVVSRAVPVRGALRSTATRAAEGSDAESEIDIEADERVAQRGTIAGPSRARRRSWRLALATGLLGFVVCVAVITVPELVAGHAIGGHHETTLFGGKRSRAKHDKQRSTTTAPATTVTAPPTTVTAPPVTTAPPAVTTPSTAPPAATAPVPTVPPATTTPAAPASP